MERYEYLNGPPAPRMVAELAMRHDALVKQLANAQATIAALQAERDGWVRSREHYFQLWMQATDERDEMRKERDDFESQLTQRTAELEAVETILDIDSGKTTVDKVRDLHHAFKQVWESYQDASNEMFKAQAELERVRAALEDACLSVAVHGEQPPQKWLDALQHRQGMEG